MIIFKDDTYVSYEYNISKDVTDVSYEDYYGSRFNSLCKIPFSYPFLKKNLFVDDAEGR